MPDLTLEVRTEPPTSTPEPLTGALVEVAHAEPPRDIRSAETDEAGVARVTISGPGSYFVTLTKSTDAGSFVGDLEVEVTTDGQVVTLPTRAVSCS